MLSHIWDLLALSSSHSPSSTSTERRQNEPPEREARACSIPARYCAPAALLSSISLLAELLLLRLREEFSSCFLFVCFKMKSNVLAFKRINVFLYFFGFEGRSVLGISSCNMFHTYLRYLAFENQLSDFTKECLRKRKPASYWFLSIVWKLGRQMEVNSEGHVQGSPDTKQKQPYSNETADASPQHEPG